MRRSPSRDRLHSASLRGPMSFTQVGGPRKLSCPVMACPSVYRTSTCMSYSVPALQRTDDTPWRLAEHDWVRCVYPYRDLFHIFRDKQMPGSSLPGVGPFPARAPSGQRCDIRPFGSIGRGPRCHPAAGDHGQGPRLGLQSVSGPLPKVSARADPEIAGFGRGNAKNHRGR